MGFSLEECERLGIAHEHPDHPSRRVDAVKHKHVPKVNEKGQNKLEARFDAYLDDMKRSGRILDYRFESMKLRLAGRCWYRIDFVVERKDRSLAGVETKGSFAREDSMIKLKLAPEVFPFMDYYIVRRDRACEAGWDVRCVTRSGFGLVPIGSEWMVKS